MIYHISTYHKTIRQNYYVLAKSDEYFKRYMLELLPDKIFNMLILWTMFVTEEDSHIEKLRRHFRQYIHPVIYKHDRAASEFYIMYKNQVCRDGIDTDFDYDKYFEMAKIKTMIQKNIKPCDIVKFFTLNNRIFSTNISVSDENTFHICPIFDKYNDVEERIEYLRQNDV